MLVPGLETGSWAGDDVKKAGLLLPVPPWPAGIGALFGWVSTRFDNCSDLKIVNKLEEEEENEVRNRRGS